MESEQCSCSCSSGAPQKVQEIRETNSTITFADKIDHFKARWGVQRMGHLVMPGLYRLGSPTRDSPVIVTANYTLSFDAVRSSLAGTDAYILVLDTKGVNVWCAAGKGTFGTGEVIRRIAVTGLASVVSHREIILPQLGAPGVSAHDVRKYTGFHVEYGPVRSRDLPEYIRTRKATRAMRRVEFTVWDRFILTPVELVMVALPAIIAAVVLYLLAGIVAAGAAIAAVLTGTVLFPILLPWIPTKDFSTKGFLLGFLVALPFAYSFGSSEGQSLYVRVASALVPLLVMPVVTAYLALNFTGSTTFTSRTGVRKEIFRYIPVMCILGGAGVIIGFVLGVARLMGVI